MVLCVAFQHVSMNFYIVCQSVLSGAGKICAQTLFCGTKRFEANLIAPAETLLQ